MNKINKSVNLLFIFALLCSILFPAGILSLILGASKDITFLLIIGIILSAGCFFGIMILWVFFGLQKSTQNHVKAIVQAKTWDLEILSKTFGKTKPALIQELRKMIRKGYLSDYVLTDDFLISREQENFDEIIARCTGNLHTVKCPSCGAISQLTYGEGYCPYCGSPLSKNN